MKTTMIALVSLVMSAGTSYAADTNATAGSKPNATVATAKTMQFLLDENQRLLKNVESLSNEVEELKSTVAYQQVMDNVLDRLVEEAYAESRADEAALSNYENLMDKVLNTLEAENEADRKEDATAMANYHQLMTSVLLSMRK